MSKPHATNEEQFDFPSDAVSFDPDAFDLAIRTQGVEMVHYTAMPCPVGMIDPDDNFHPRGHHDGCSNGYVYTPAGTVICLFLSNSKESRGMDIGRVDSSTVTVTMPRFYEKDDPNAADIPVQPAPFDRLYLKDEGITPVVTWEKIACSDTGIDKLRYPVINVVSLVDARNVRHSQGVDFDVVEGKIVWRPGKSPGLDLKSQRGVVCSVRYTYRPFWYVQRMVHEVRVGQVEDPFSGDRVVMRFPQQMVLQREHVFENAQADSKAPADARQNPGPNDRPYNVTGLGTK